MTPVRVLAPVIGMHRSGTSATAGCLQRLGVDFGRDLMSADPANPRGYYESLPVVKLHEELLHGLGARWDSPEIRGDWLLTQEADTARRRIVEWLSALGGGISGVKDPRMALFGPLWREACSQTGVEMRPVMVMRGADAISNSLARRDGISRQRSRQLMAVYGSGVMDWVWVMRAPSVIRFERLMADPVSELAGGLLDNFRDVLPVLRRPDAGAWDAVTDFLDEGLVHG